MTNRLLTAAKLKIIICALLVLFACRNISGQIFSFHSYKLSDGLISNNVETICQDSLGYIWIGTLEGISVFDSKEFRNYSTASGLSSNKIFSITADKQMPGTIWIGTGGGGVDKFENGKFYSFGLNLPLKMKTINSLFDYKDKIWCGTDSGFYFIQHDKVHLIHLPVKTGAVLSFAQLNNNEILLACEAGLFKYSISKGTLDKIILPDAWQSGFVSVIADKDSTIYALALNGILFKINHSGISKIILGFTPRAMIEDNKDYLWIGTYDGLFKINKRSFSQKNIQLFTNKTGLDDDNIPSLLFDRENILWIGTNQEGISKFTYQNLLLYKVPPELNSSEWASSAADINNHIWIAYSSGLAELWKGESGAWHIYNFYSAGPAKLKNVFYIAIDNDLMYLSTVDNKIYIFKIEHPVRSTNRHSKLILKEKINLEKRFKNASLFKILVDKSGLIWCSLLNLGVAVLDNSFPVKVLKIYSTKDGLPDNSVRSIREEKGGSILISTRCDGLAFYKNSLV